jgi:DNA-binding transcriptional LysR family regulator
MDLNLVRIFITIYESESITESAKILHVTQPSISYALKKLRFNFNDELFIRQTVKMIPTAKAKKIYKVFKNSLLQIDHLLEEEKYDINKIKGEIKIAVSDLGSLFFIPFIYDKIIEMAPNVNLEVIQLDNDNIKKSILRGEVDICIGNKIDELKDLCFDIILKDEYIGIIDANQVYDEKNIKEYSFISVSSHAGHKYLEKWMEFNNLTIKLKIPNFNSLDYMIKTNNHIAIVPYTATQHIKSKIKIIDLPFDLPILEIGIYKSNNSMNSKLCQWILNEISQHNWYY